MAKVSCALLVILSVSVARGLEETPSIVTEASSSSGDHLDEEIRIGDRSSFGLIPAHEPPANDLESPEVLIAPDADVDNWEAPEWIIKNFPSYLSGYDYEGRPIWVSEWGKMDVRPIVDAGEESMKQFTKFIDRTSRLIYNTTMAESNPMKEVNFIIDFDGYDMAQLSHVRAVRYMMSLGTQYRGLLESGRVAKVFIINANYPTQLAIRLAKSIFGRLFEVLEVYGTNRDVWIPKLLRVFPRDQLPPWYGGTKDHKPILVYG